MNMLSSLKALLFSSASPGVAAAQPAAPGDTADFATLFNGTMAEEAVIAPALPQIDAPLVATPTPAVPAVPAMPELPAIEGQDAAVATPLLPTTAGQPEAAPAHGHVPHGLAIAVAAGKSLPSQLPPGRALGLVKQLADMPVDEQTPTEPAHLQQPEAGLPDEAPIAPQVSATIETPVPPEPASPEQATLPVQSPKPQPAAHQDKAERDPFMPVVEETAPVEPTSSPKQKAKAERTEQDPAPLVPVPQPLAAAAAIVPPIAAEPVAQAPATSAEPITAAPDVAAVMTVPLPPVRPTDPAPVQSAPEQISADQPTIRSDSKQPSEALASPVIATARETPVPEVALSEAPVFNGKPVKAEAIALLQIVRDQVAARQTGAPVRVGELVSAAAHAKADAPARPTEAAADPSTALPPADVAPAAPVVTAPQTSAISVPTAAPALQSPDLSASLGAQVVDMGVSGQWIDGLARDIAGLSANGAQGRFQIDTHHLGAVQVDIRHDTDGAAVSLTVASEAAEMALRQDSDRLKLDAGLAAVRIAEVKVERAPAIAEAHRAETSGQSSSQQQPSQQGSQTSAWAQNGGQNMGQPQGQQNRWQGRENNGFGPKGSGDPAVLNHADAQPAAHERARARYA